MRKAKPKKRQVLPDPVFGDVKVTKFVNHLMYDGKKSIAFDIFYTALEIVGKKIQQEDKSALEIWKAALDNITPQVEVKSRRIGGATFQVPTEIRAERKESISMKISLLQRSWMHSIAKVLPSSARKICTVWQKPTAHLLTSDSKNSKRQWLTTNT